MNFKVEYLRGLDLFLIQKVKVKVRYTRQIHN